jgi:hypothetical protein
MKTAPIVLEIFERVIAGDTFGVISRDLNSRGIPGVLGGKWTVIIKVQTQNTRNLIEYFKRGVLQ